MDAKTYTGKNGWDKAKQHLETMNAEDWHNQFYKDLKTLVDAYVLAQSGLLELKKAMFSESEDLDYVKKWVLTVSEKLLTEKGIKLKQAIKLVESVDEND